MSNVQFSDDKVAALVDELNKAPEGVLIFTSNKFWKRFGVRDEMSELEAQVTEKFKAMGVIASFEAYISLPDAEAQAALAEVEGAFTDESLQAVVESVNEAENQTLFVPTESFWGHFGLEDTMRELQSIAAEKLGAVGLEAAFGVFVSVPQESEEGDVEESPMPVSGDPFTQEKLQEWVDGTAAQDNRLLYPTTDVFWADFGLTDHMQEYQDELTEKLADAGVELSFNVALELIPPELPLTMDFNVPARPAPLDLNVETVRALSIRQPWVELILWGRKNLEYRSRRMKETGPLLIRASRTLDEENIAQHGFKPEDLPFGALVGIVDVVGCIEVEGEDGLYAYQLAHPRRFRTPLPYSGAAGIFRVPVTEVRKALAGGVELVPARS